jgi:hypothetical protein
VVRYVDVAVYYDMLADHIEHMGLALVVVQAVTALSLPQAAAQADTLQPGSAILEGLADFQNPAESCGTAY